MNELKFKLGDIFYWVKHEEKSSLIRKITVEQIYIQKNKVVYQGEFGNDYCVDYILEKDYIFLSLNEALNHIRDYCHDK